MNMKMLLRPISIFVAIQIVTWRHAAEGQPTRGNPQSELPYQESVNPPANPADCDEECQCETEDNKSQRCVKEIIYCPELNIPDNVVWDGSCRKAIPGDACRFKCKQNVTLEGKDEIFCNSISKWSAVVPRCEEIKYCPELVIPDNVIGEGSCRKAKPGDPCRFKCKENVTLQGKDEIFCNSSSKWSAVVPRCEGTERNYCPGFDITGNVCRKAKPGEACYFKCEENLNLIENGMFCLSPVDWSGVVPRCEVPGSPFDFDTSDHQFLVHAKGFFRNPNSSSGPTTLEEERVFPSLCKVDKQYLCGFSCNKLDGRYVDCDYTHQSGDKFKICWCDEQGRSLRQILQNYPSSSRFHTKDRKSGLAKTCPDDDAWLCNKFCNDSHRMWCSPVSNKPKKHHCHCSNYLE